MRNPYLNGQLLLAMPTIGDQRFERAAIYICAHDKNGAMGIVINHVIDDLQFGTLLKDLDIQSDIKLPERFAALPVMRGGPVDTARGFLIHSKDFKQIDTIEVQKDIFVTGTIDGLLSLKQDDVPQNALFALGYAGWQAGQLEAEMKKNAWLNLPATTALVFDEKSNKIWDSALCEIGVTPAQLNAFSGHA